MSRVQLALNVSDIEEAVEFYSKFFGTEPAKRRPGYANFAIADPPLKLVLLEDITARGHGTVGALNHLGVEVETTDEVTAATGRLNDEGMATEIEEQTT
jgi:catechol 2,3-dioxygenase-like lactoylglutathione lyase family enzyme